MKKIYSLKLSQLTTKQHFTYMQLAVAACTLYAIISEEFGKLVEALAEAFEQENYAFECVDRTFITERLQKADAERIRLFRHMRDYIKTFETCNDQAKIEAAEILMKIIALYGGGNIPSLKADERSAAIFNLIEDFEQKYAEQVEALGCSEMLPPLKAANQVYIDIATERAQYDSENGLKMVATACKKTNAVYHALVSTVNAAASVDRTGKLIPYIDYMNVNVRRYRISIGQSTADMDGVTSNGESTGDTEEGAVLKNVTFKFANGNEQKFRLEVGAPLEALVNTPGYTWKPEVPEFVPNRNIIFREVLIEAEQVTATFHFFDHTEEDIRQAAGTPLMAPTNTVGYRWDPEVPATMPAEDTAYYELPISTPDGGGNNENEDEYTPPDNDGGFGKAVRRLDV